MQDQDLEFLRGGVAEAARVLERDPGADGDVSAGAVLSREREHVCGFVFVAEAAVQFLDAAAAGHKHGNLTANSGELLRCARKAFQPGGTDAIQILFNHDHKSG